MQKIPTKIYIWNYRHMWGAWVKLKYINEIGINYRCVGLFF